MRSQTIVSVTPRLTTRMAESKQEVLRALKLRYRVFAEEMGASLHAGLAGMDADEFDPYCKHMLVIDAQTQAVVGYSRIIDGGVADSLGRYYSEAEFDLSRVLKNDRRFMEIGRTCVDPAYRGGAVINALWGGFTRFMLENNIDYLMGCASIPMQQGSANAHAIMQTLRETHLSPEEYRVYPLKYLPPSLVQQHEASIPPLLKAYLRVGVKICGEPCWDPDFNTADFFILLDRHDINPRYIRHFIDREPKCLRVA